MKIPTHPSAVRTCVLRVRQVKHLVSVSNACKLRGEDFVSDLQRVSGSNNAKLQTSASKSLLLKRRPTAGKEREWELHVEQTLSCVMSKQELT